MQPQTTLDATGADHHVRPAASGLRARAWLGGELLAETDDALRVEEDGQPPSLYVPATAVRWDLLLDEGRTTACPVKGTARLWSLPDPGAPLPGAPGGSPDWHAGDDDGPVADGRDVAWAFTAPSDGCGFLADRVAFDHDRLRVEVVDGGPEDDPHDVPTLRFPTWGDAADLIGLLDVQPDGEGRWVSGARADWRRPVAEGSQLLGQAIVAASRTAHGRRPVAAQLLFTRAADAARPVAVELDPVADGRTFTALDARVTQGGRTCATGSLLLDATAPDLVRHAVPPPAVPGPLECRPYDMSVTGRDLRIVDDAYTGDPDAPVGPPTLDAWVRFRRVPEEPCLHAALLAQLTGHLSIAAALRPHPGVGQAQAHRSISTAINAISISIHADVRADRWMLYHHHATFAGDGMTHSECRVHTEDGALLASFTVDAMVRAMPARTAPDDRTAL